MTSFNLKRHYIQGRSHSLGLCTPYQSYDFNISYGEMHFNKQDSTNYSPPTAFSLLLLVNKVLWEHSHTHLFTFNLFIMLAIFQLQRLKWVIVTETIGILRPKTLPSGPFPKRFGDSWARETLIVGQSWMAFEVKLKSKNLTLKTPGHVMRCW